MDFFLKRKKTPVLPMKELHTDSFMFTHTWYSGIKFNWIYFPILVPLLTWLTLRREDRTTRNKSVAQFNENAMKVKYILGKQTSCVYDSYLFP